MVVPSHGERSLLTGSDAIRPATAPATRVGRYVSLEQLIYMAVGSVPDGSYRRKKEYFCVGGARLPLTAAVRRGPAEIGSDDRRDRIDDGVTRYVLVCARRSMR
jgi:hypothetical protein